MAKNKAAITVDRRLHRQLDQKVYKNLYLMLELFKQSQNKKFFFENYAKAVTNWRQKCIGKNRNGNDIKFTNSDITAIQQGLNQLFKELDESNSLL